ncbi:MAG: polysaccharide deacetylase family protein [Rhizobiaceae bacterium]
MRIKSCLFGTALLCLVSDFAQAACSADALGTSRTVVLDPTKLSSVSGKESSLGLRNKEVVLTFDDGPVAGNTSRVLTALGKECVKATFFTVGKMARYYPKVIRRIVREGHTLAHHTHDHNRLPNYSKGAASSLIDLGIKQNQKIAYRDDSTVARVPFFRYPYLARSAQTDKILAEKGLIAFGANIDALDWKSDTPQVVHDRIMRKVRQQGRGIILMHDIQTRTAKMLPDLLQSLKSEGYKVVHVAAKPGKPVKTKPLLVASLVKGEKAYHEESSPDAAMAKGKKRLRNTVQPRVLYEANGVRVRKSKPKAKKPAVKTASVTGKKRRDSKTHALRKNRYVFLGSSRRSSRNRKPVILASARRPIAVKKGGLKLRRSQWILR